MPLSSLIVDDERLAREGLRQLLLRDPDITAIQEARNGREAVKLIRASRPDLVFLDVQMPEMDAFGVIQEVGLAAMPLVVFVTAHDAHAIRAFEISAIDYLLKPVTGARFEQALARAKAQLRAPADGQAQIVSLLETIASPQRFLKRVAVRSPGKTYFVNIDDVEWIGAAENYVELHVGETTHLLHVKMGTLEDSLDPAMFLRIHRSLIVNIGGIKEMQSANHGEYMIVLHSGVRLQSSRTYHAKLKALTANPF
jgi:two-component system LytT family response regulator